MIYLLAVALARWELVAISSRAGSTLPGRWPGVQATLSRLARDDRDKEIASGLDQMVTKLRSQPASPTKGHAGGTNDNGGQPQDRV
jgi:hypothetical protein